MPDHPRPQHFPQTPPPVFTCDMGAALDRMAAWGHATSPLGEVWLALPARAHSEEVARRMAARQGIDAGTRQLPLGEVLRRMAGDEPGNAFGAASDAAGGDSTDQLAWVVFHALARPELSALIPRTHQCDEQGLRRLALAKQVAQALEDGLTYRPQWFVRTGEKEGAWRVQLSKTGHGELWTGPDMAFMRHVLALAQVGRLLGGHLAFSVDSAGKLSDGAARMERFRRRFPRVERIAVLLSGAIPPLHLSLLGQLPLWAPDLVRVVAWGPSAGYWGDAILKRGKTASSEGWEDLFPGGLLHGLGRSSKHLHLQLTDAWEARGAGMETLEAAEIDSDSLLHAMQADARLGAGASGGQEAGGMADASFSIHGCQGRVRMGEVLRDQVREAIEAGFAPEDILILLADPAQDVPWVAAAFQGDASNDAARIPLRLLDGPVAQAHPLSGAFLSSVRVLGGRGSLRDGLDLLEHEAVRRRFGLSQEEVARAAGWLEDANVRWGFDAAHRGAHGRPQDERFSWAFGLRRLALGAMLPADRPPGFPEPPLALVDGQSALGRASGLEAAALAKLAVFAESLSRHAAAWAKDAPMPEWISRSHALLDRMLDAGDGPGADEGESRMDALRKALEILEAGAETEPEKSEQGARAGLLSPAVFGRALGLALESFAESLWAARGGGGVRVMGLRGGHGVPAKVVFIAGLDQGKFPRMAEVPSLSPLRVKPDLGDRSPRDADRQWILETLLSASGRVAVLYDAGIGPQPVPPSPVVSDLLEAARQTARAHGLPADGMVVMHPFTPFSAEYFKPGRPPLKRTRVPFARALAQAVHRPQGLPAGTGAGQSDEIATLVAPQLLGPPEKPEIWDLKRLRSFWDLPCRDFLRAQGFHVPEKTDPLADEDAVEPGTLESWGLRDEVLQAVLEPANSTALEELQNRHQAAGNLPIGELGKRVWEKVVGEAEGISAKAGLGQTSQRPMKAGGVVQGETLPFAQLGDLLVRVIASKPKGRHLLRAWVDALAVVAGGGKFSSLRVVGDGKDGDVECVLPEQAEAEAQLRTLIALAGLGLRTPLPFFHEIEGADDADGLAMQRDRHPAIALAFAGRDPFKLAAPKEVEGIAADGPFFDVLRDAVIKPVELAREQAEALAKESAPQAKAKAAADKPPKEKKGPKA